MTIILSSDADELFYVHDHNKISFELQSTTELDAYADEIRERKGYAPFFDESQEYWDNGWYDFYLEINPFEECVLGIACVVCGNDSDGDIVPDDKDYYMLEDYINIDKDKIMEQLVAELRKRHTSLEEIRKEIEKDDLL